MPARFQPIPAGTDPSQMIATVNNNFAQLDNEGVNKIYRGDDGVPRIFIDGTTGVIKVAPAGTDVTTATDSELTFNSSQNVFKVVTASTTSITVPDPPVAGSFYSSTVAHGLSHTPLVVASVFDGSLYQFLPLTVTVYSAGSILIDYTLTCYADATNVVFRFQSRDANPLKAGTYNIKYYLLQESAN